MTTRPLDTSAEGWTVQRAAMARLSGEARIRTAIELSEAVRTLQLEGLLARNPHWTRAEAVQSLLDAIPGSSPGRPLSLDEFLSRVARSLSESGVPFMLTGSLAAAYYGTPRATQNIDLVIDPGESQLNRLVDLLLEGGLYVSREDAAEALEKGSQFNVIDASTGWKADLIIRRAREFSRTEFDRRQPAHLFGVELALTTAEDLIIAKLEWSELGDSELQRYDIAQLLDAGGGSLDLAYVEKWIAELGLEEAWAKLERYRD